MRKEIPHISPQAKKIYYKPRKTTNSGLMKKYTISDALADFLGVDHNSQYSRIDITCAICAYAHIKDDEDRDKILQWAYLNPEGKRNLQNPRDKRAIIPDKHLKKLLKYEKYQKDVKAKKITKKIKNKETGEITKIPVDNDFLYYWVIQRLISVHLS